MIREATRGDLPRLRAIQTALSEPWPELLETAVDGPPTVLVVTAEAPVGYAVVLGAEGETAYVPEFAVHPDHQGAGHGSRLMAFLLERLAGRYRSVRLTVREGDERVRSFYAGFGFEPVDRVAGHFEDDDGVVLARGVQPVRSRRRSGRGRSSAA